VLEALLRVSKRALKGWIHIGLAVAAFVAIAVFNLPFPLVVLAAAIFGFLVFRGQAVENAIQKPVSYKALFATIAVGLVVWFAPIVFLFAPGSSPVFTDLALFFSQAAIVTFGGAYAVLSYVGDVAVTHYRWLEPREMITGLGLAETTPGPLILVLLFVGFLAGARQGMVDPLTGGLMGALITLWFTFVPSFVMIFAGAPFVERIRSMPRLAGALQGVTSSVVGVIASLGLWFAVTLFFPKGITPLPDMLWHMDIAAVIIALAAGLALLRFHIGFGWVLSTAALAGAALKLGGI
jgi:chromate transporter